ncbi:hypothetical protein ACE1AT_21825 [Pelatocladus sp. BLCC-F211]|uniref:hypothetical protein n=1 Tax=Pelatocladus sp. BLCC-F211 TaxID=3342752 RepID=UPI0035B6CAEB
MSFLLLKFGLIIAQTQQNPNPGQAASTITNDGVTASVAVAQAMDKLWDSVLDGDLYGAIANVGVLFALGTLLIFMVQWVREILDGESSKAFTDMIYPILVIYLLSNNAEPLASATKGLRRIINQTNTTLLKTTSSSIQLQEAYQKVMAKGGREDLIAALQDQCKSIADPKEESSCLEKAAKQAQEIAGDDKGWFNGVQEFLNTNIFQLFIRGFLFTVGLGFQWIVEMSLLLTALMGPLAVGGSLLPVGKKSIFAWLVGFFSVGLVKLSYNIICGLVATLIFLTNNPLQDPMLLPVVTGLLAPFLSVFLATGSGIAVFNSLSTFSLNGISLVAKNLLKVSR